jgi:hypothetical protein
MKKDNKSVAAKPAYPYYSDDLHKNCKTTVLDYIVNRTVIAVFNPAPEKLKPSYPDACNIYNVVLGYRGNRAGKCVEDVSMRSNYNGMFHDSVSDCVGIARKRKDDSDPYPKTLEATGDPVDIASLMPKIISKAQDGKWNKVSMPLPYRIKADQTNSASHPIMNSNGFGNADIYVNPDVVARSKKQTGIVYRVLVGFSKSGAYVSVHGFFDTKTAIIKNDCPIYIMGTHHMYHEWESKIIKVWFSYRRSSDFAGTVLKDIFRYADAFVKAFDLGDYDSESIKSTLVSSAMDFLVAK